MTRIETVDQLDALPIGSMPVVDEAEIRERIAQEIEADMNHNVTRNATLATAARIARGETR